MSDVNELAETGEPAVEREEAPTTPSGNPMDPPTYEETHADWMRYFAADKAGLIDPKNEHLNEWVAFYDGRVVGYGTGMIETQERAAAELGVHWARVVVDYLGWG